MCMRTNNKGFTLIELLVVISVIGFITAASVLAFNSARIKTRDAKRLADLKQISKALELYYNDYNRYPLISHSTEYGWRSECAVGGWFAAKNVIPNLVPNYLGSFPSDPAMKKYASKCCYLYFSSTNGKDYAILDYNCPEINYRNQPSLVDPARDGGANTCIVDGTGIWAWKVSSPGGRCW